MTGGFTCVSTAHLGVHIASVVACNPWGGTLVHTSWWAWAAHYEDPPRVHEHNAPALVGNPRPGTLRGDAQLAPRAGTSIIARLAVGDALPLLRLLAPLHETGRCC